MNPKPSDVPPRTQRKPPRPANGRRAVADSIPVFTGASTQFRVGVPLEEPPGGWDRWIDAIVAALATLVPEPAAGPVAERVDMGGPGLRIWNQHGQRFYGPGDVIDLLI